MSPDQTRKSQPQAQRPGRESIEAAVTAGVRSARVWLENRPACFGVGVYRHNTCPVKCRRYAQRCRAKLVSQAACPTQMLEAIQDTDPEAVIIVLDSDGLAKFRADFTEAAR